MKLTLVLTLASLQSAFAGASSCPFSHWKPPGEGDIRGPCPMLNTLANHGLLPHDGKDIAQEETANALQALNIQAEFAAQLHEVACITNQRTPNATTFSLSDLSNHNILEHDASLSRQDFYFGDVQPFNQSVFDQTRSYWTGPEIDIQMGANALVARQNTSEETNPTFNLTDVGRSFAYAETAAYIIIFGDLVAGTAKKALVEYFFENERLPLELGWKAPENPITLDVLNSMYNRVVNATGRFNETLSTTFGKVKRGNLHTGNFDVFHH